jgi:hypothetical protein
MDLSPGALFASLLVGTIGFGFFLYGRKQHRIPQLLAGLVLMAYPYFIESMGWMLGVGALVMAALWIVVRMGL